MDQWVKVMSAKGFQVCVEKSVTDGMPSVIFRIQKDGGILRSQMCVPPEFPGTEAMTLAVATRDHIFNNIDSETCEAAVESMLELEPELMDGSVHGFVVESEPSKH